MKFNRVDLIVDGDSKQYAGGLSNSQCKQLATVIRKQKMHSLSLRNINIGWRGMSAIAEALRDSTSVTFLKLDTMLYLSDVALKVLFEMLVLNHSIERFVLACTIVGDKAVPLLAKLLMKNDSLLSVKLDNNELGALGARAIANALCANKRLIEFSYRNNPMEQVGIDSFARLCRCNSTLMLLDVFGSLNYYTAPLMNELSGNTSLVELDLGANRFTGNSLGNVLATNKRLRILNLKYSQGDVTALVPFMMALKENSTLSKLDLTGTRLGTAGIALLGDALRCNSTIEWLSVSFEDFFEDFYEYGHFKFLHTLWNYNIGIQTLHQEPVDKRFKFVEIALLTRNMKLRRPVVKERMQHLFVGLRDFLHNDVYLSLAIVDCLPHCSMLDRHRKVAFLQAMVDCMRENSWHK